MTSIHTDRLVASARFLWTTHMYSDLTIRSGEEKYEVHRSIVCPRSAFFAKACNGQFMEGKTGIITMDDDEPQAVKRMLLYLYTLDYPEEDECLEVGECLEEDDPKVPMDSDRSHPCHLPSEAAEGESDLGTTSAHFDGATPPDSRMMNNVLVYAVAEKYDIPELKDLAMHKFHTLATSKWPHNEFYTVTEAVFSTTPESDMGLRQIVMDVCKDHCDEILRDKETRTSLLENKAIAAAILDATVRQIDENVELLDEALGEQRILREELKVVESAERLAVIEKDTWTSQLDRLLESANKIEACRHCHREPKWLLERVETSYSGLQLLLRCASCRTKHGL